MSIRKIRANSAKVDGDYVCIEEYSARPGGTLGGFVLGCILAAIVGSTNLIIIIIILLVCSVAGFVFSPGRVVRSIPEVDLVEIKHYPDEERVTVVLDDARTKRKQATSAPKQ